uniref:SH3 domain-containing protein n=1 Tax=Acrobeloides nanus TaxID=290746 RepID=A0A914CNW7_9BILA
MNGIVGVAINPYVPQEDDKLQLNKGDFVKILEKSPDGWWRGEANGHSGWFPSSYVEEISDKPAIETVIAPCPFEAQRSDELSFIQGECLEIIEKSFNNSDWCIARNETGQIGLISNNYIENGKPNLFERLLNWIKDLSVEQNEKLKNKEITDLIMNYNKIDNSLDKSEILREAINNKQYKIYAYLQFSERNGLLFGSYQGWPYFVFGVKDKGFIVKKSYAR